MKITDGAKQFLENFLNEKDTQGIRIFSITGGVRVTIYDEFRSTKRNR